MTGTQLWLLASLAFASLACLADGAPPVEASGSQLDKQGTTITIPFLADNCTLQKKERISTDERMAKACEKTTTSQTDFVYKVRVEEFAEGFFTDVYTMQVVDVIKEGSYDLNPLKQLRTFLSPPHCRSSLDLHKGKTYLIMGTSTEIFKNDASQSYQYVLGGRTWIEYWPTETECRTAEHRPTCVGLQETSDMFAVFGCPL